MKVVIQIVNKSSVDINNRIKSEIQKGLLVLIGIGLDDDEKDAEWLANKVLNLRVFNDSEGIMNKLIAGDVDKNEKVFVKQVYDFIIKLGTKGDPDLLMIDNRKGKSTI